METKGKYFELERPFLDALKLLGNPALGVTRSERDTIKAALRSEWERVFPGKPFPGDTLTIPPLVGDDAA